jgi:predicted nucleic acid-binding protein
MSGDGLLLDTNVISEVMRPQPDLRVMGWMNAQDGTQLFLSTTSLAELLSGLANMPDGQRKIGLQALLKRLRTNWFAGRVLPFTEDAAERYGIVVSDARRRGRAISVPDGQIAAIASVHGFAVATRDTEPFEAAGVPVINPWRAASDARSRLSE